MEQGAFLPGRSANDNILLAQEVAHLISSWRRQNTMVMLKLDLAKAFDTGTATWRFVRTWDSWLTGTPG